MKNNELLDISIDAAILGGKQIMDVYAGSFEVFKKEDESPLTVADQNANEVIIRELKKTKIPVLSEEGRSIPYSERKNWDRLWIVDPLDGTTNFLHGLPHWAVSIALEHKGEIISGVIYDPCKDEMFLAEKGIGAWMNETRLRVSARHSIADSLYATGIPFSGRIEDLPETINDLKKLMPNCSGVRRYGAAALDLAYVAAGRYEGYWERNLNNWDIAAGVIIAREAGAMVESISTAGDPLIDGNIIAASEVQFNKFAKIIRE